MVNLFAGFLFFNTDLTILASIRVANFISKRITVVFFLFVYTQVGPKHWQEKSTTYLI